MLFINKTTYLKNKYNSLLRSLLLKISNEDNYKLIAEHQIRKVSKKLDFDLTSVAISNFTFENVSIEKIFLRRNSSDLLVFYQIFIQREYKFLIEAFKNNFKTGGEPINIVDLGGNIGLTSIYASINFPSSKIIILEPSKDNFEVLSKNIQSIIKQNKNTKISILNKGIWRNKCKLAISNKQVDGWAVQVIEDNCGEIDAISMFDLQEFMPNIDILKIDIEGSEFIIINNDVNCDWLLNVKVIAIEIHKKLGNESLLIKKICSYGFIYCGCVGETVVFIRK